MGQCMSWNEKSGIQAGLESIIPDLERRPEEFHPYAHIYTQKTFHLEPTTSLWEKHPDLQAGGPRAEKKALRSESDLLLKRLLGGLIYPEGQGGALMLAVWTEKP